MSEINYFDHQGFTSAVYNTNFNENYCIKLSDYGYDPTSKPYSERIWLKLVGNGEKNALGMSNGHWGRTAWNGAEKFKYLDDNGISHSVPVVDFNYGLIPMPTPNSTSSPFAVSRTYSASTTETKVFVRYNQMSDCCEASTDESTWVRLNSGPGIFFILTGGGGGGANGKASIAPWGPDPGPGAGGGGGASMIGYLDLRSVSEYSSTSYGLITKLYFILGTGGEQAGTKEGQSGGDGGTSSIYAEMSKLQGNPQWLYHCYGGKGGSSGLVKPGGDGGTCSRRNASEYGAQYLQPFLAYDGKKGGTSGDGSSANPGLPGGSFSETVRVSLGDAIEKNYLAFENNGVRGQGTNAIKNSAHTERGGGGGQTIISSGNSNRGSGGYGGSIKPMSTWAQGQPGGSGTLQILTIS